jgi:Voltage-dependent anion channel
MSTRELPTTVAADDACSPRPARRLLRELEHPSELFANLGPNWFASVMGTGIVANAAALLPLSVPGFQTAALIVWMLAAALLIVLLSATAVHWMRHPKAARSHAGNPAMAPFYGAPPMALLTVGAGARHHAGVGATGLPRPRTRRDSPHTLDRARPTRTIDHRRKPARQPGTAHDRRALRQRPKRTGRTLRRTDLGVRRPMAMPRGRYHAAHCTRAAAVHAELVEFHLPGRCTRDRNLRARPAHPPPRVDGRLNRPLRLLLAAWATAALNTARGALTGGLFRPPRTTASHASTSRRHRAPTYP